MEQIAEDYKDVDHGSRERAWFRLTNQVHLQRSLNRQALVRYPLEARANCEGVDVLPAMMKRVSDPRSLKCADRAVLFYGEGEEESEEDSSGGKEEGSELSEEASSRKEKVVNGAKKTGEKEEGPDVKIFRTEGPHQPVLFYGEDDEAVDKRVWARKAGLESSFRHSMRSGASASSSSTGAPPRAGTASSCQTAPAFLRRGPPQPPAGNTSNNRNFYFMADGDEDPPAHKKKTITLKIPKSALEGKEADIKLSLPDRKKKKKKRKKHGKKLRPGAKMKVGGEAGEYSSSEYESYSEEEESDETEPAPKAPSKPPETPQSTPKSPTKTPTPAPASTTRQVPSQREPPSPPRQKKIRPPPPPPMIVRVPQTLPDGLTDGPLKNTMEIHEDR